METRDGLVKGHSTLEVSHPVLENDYDYYDSLPVVKTAFKVRNLTNTNTGSKVKILSKSKIDMFKDHRSQSQGGDSSL